MHYYKHFMASKVIVVYFYMIPLRTWGGGGGGGETTKKCVIQFINENQLKAIVIITIGEKTLSLLKTLCGRFCSGYLPSST